MKEIKELDDGKVRIERLDMGPLEYGQSFKYTVSKFVIIHSYFDT